jgi:antirestriction protein ArdC
MPATATATRPRRATPPTPKHDLYADVTAQIVAALEAGSTSFIFPWHHVPGPPQNVFSQRPYRGINTVLLWLIGHAKGYSSPHWATFRQWRELGHPVCKGEQAATIVFWKPLQPGAASSTPAPGDTADAEATDHRRFVARAYHVFNAAQVTGFTVPDMPILPDTARDAAAEHFFNALPLTVHHGETHAFYRPTTDSIHLPPFARFIDANAYYATRGHESVHATGAKHRLDRNLTGRFGSEHYAVEELIAELGAAFLCADLGLSPTPRPDHAGYIASWLKVLRGDVRAVFTAAGLAQTAVDWLHAQQPNPVA